MDGTQLRPDTGKRMGKGLPIRHVGLDEAEGRGSRLDGQEIPAEAGRILARQSARNDFTLYEYFQTDRAGHSGEMARCRAELAKLEEFLGSLLGTLEAEAAEPTLVLLTSDHGNLEDLSTRRHTTNPVPLAAWGQGAEELLRRVERLDQVAGAILERHGLSGT